MKSGWKIAWRNLGKNRRRSTATAAAIAFGYTGLALLGGYIIHTEAYLRINSVYLHHVGQISIFHKDGFEKELTQPAKYSLTTEEQRGLDAILKNAPEVEFVGKYLEGVGIAGNGTKSFPFIGTALEPETERRIRSLPIVLKWDPELAAAKEGKGVWEQGLPDNAVAITPGLARLLGKTQDNTIQLAARTFDGDFSAVDAQVVGQYSTGLALTEDTGLLAPLSLFRKLFGTDSLTYEAVFLKPGVHVHSFMRKLDRKLKAQGLQLSLYPYDTEQMSLFYVGVMNFLFTMAIFFIFLVLSVVILSIINSVGMAVLERTREIGTLQSLGYPRELIASLFVKETFLLSVISLVGGTVLIELICFLINSANFRFAPPGISGDMQFILTPAPWLCLSLALLIGTVTCLTCRQTVLMKTKRTVAELLTALSA